MTENTHRKLDVIFKIVGFIGAIMAFCWGIRQYREQGERELNLEKHRAYWSSQNQLYIDICNNAGALAATVSDPEKFEIERIKFLSQYYGQIALVSDTTVEKCLVKIRDYLFDVNLRDPNNQISFKSKVLELSKACKKSSEIFNNELR